MPMAQSQQQDGADTQDGRTLSSWHAVQTLWDLFDMYQMTLLLRYIRATSATAQELYFQMPSLLGFTWAMAWAQGVEVPVETQEQTQHAGAEQKLQSESPLAFCV